MSALATNTNNKQYPNIFLVKSGSIFNADVEALVNPVNCVGVMGAGLAKEFKKRFPENYKQYVGICQYQEREIDLGRMFIFHQKEEKPEYIINFPTKWHWKDKSDIKYIYAGLDDLKYEMRVRKIKSVAIPAIGCGLGGLKWGDVYPVN